MLQIIKMSFVNCHTDSPTVVPYHCFCLLCQHCCKFSWNPFYSFLFKLCFTNIKLISPKTVNPSTADQWQIGSPGGCGWLEKTKGIVGNKAQVVPSPETSEIAAN